ncbi:MAG: OmpA family protein [Mariprofundaceae bacterium]|nr:OmpA family protein [Mariprofundaceae bacterium]
MMQHYIHGYTSIVRSVLVATCAGLLFTGCHTLTDREYVTVKKMPKQVIILEQNDMRLEENIDNLRKAVESMRKDMKEPIKNRDARVEQLSSRSARVTLQNKVLFSNGSTNFSKAGKKVLSQFAKSMKKNKNLHVRIVGHTDSRLPTPRLQERYLDNWEISAARSASVARYLTWEQHIDPKRITIVGVADNQPVASNATAKGRKLNRRVELYLEV